MPKFYVSSGSLQLVVEADDARAAAIWSVHRWLSPVLLPICDEHTAGNQFDSHLSYESAEPQRRLGDWICVSEQGFGGSDRQELPALPIVAEWTRLLVALEELHGQLA